MVSLARKNLLHDRLRFAITVAGVAFAVTLVLVQVGLFMGLLDKATVTIEQRERRHLGHLAQTRRTSTSRTPSPRPRVLRVRGVPGVERADNLIVQFMNIQLPNGRRRRARSSTRSRTSRPGTCPGASSRARRRDLKRGYSVLMDRSAELRFGPFAIGELPRDPAAAASRSSARRARPRPSRRRRSSSWTSATRRSCRSTLRGNTTYVLVKLAPGADRPPSRRELRRRLPYNDVLHARGVGARARATTG